MRLSNKNKLLKKTCFMVMIICLTVVFVACSRKDNKSDKIEADKVETDQEEGKLEIRNLPEGYFGVYDIMFPVPYGMDSTNSDYKPDQLQTQAYMPTQFRGWVNNGNECELWVTAYDLLKTDEIENKDIAQLIRNFYEARDMTTDDIAKLVNEIYMIRYDDDEYYLKDQQYIELPGLGIEAVRNTVHVDRNSGLELKNDFIATCFVFKDKLYTVSMDRWENHYERVFPNVEIKIYETLLQEIEEAKISNENDNIGTYDPDDFGEVNDNE